MNTDRWYYRVFQSAPDLIRALLPGSAAAANPLVLDPSTPGDRLYRFEALAIKELSHRLDGVLWPRESTGCAESGSPEFPVVLLEEQMHPDPGFHHRLAAQTYRFLQQQPQVEHWLVLVITPHNRLNLGPTQGWRGARKSLYQSPPPPQPPRQPSPRRHHRPDSGDAAGATESPGCWGFLLPDIHITSGVFNPAICNA